MKITSDNTLELKPGHVYLVFIDPAKVDFDHLPTEFTDPEIEAFGKQPPDVIFIPMRDGVSRPEFIESIAEVEEWLAEVKESRA